MAAERNPEGSVLPAEMPLLLFRAAGVPLGVEAAAVEGILDAEQARQSGIACRGLAQLLGSAPETSAAVNMHLLLKSRKERCGLGIDGLDEFVTVPTAALQPLPAPLAFFRGPRTFWAGMVRGNKVVLLVDADRLQEPSPAIDEAHL